MAHAPSHRGSLPVRLTLPLPLLLAFGLLLAGCGGDSEDDDPSASPIADLPAESRLIVNASGVVPFDGSSEQFLAILPFEPLLPSAVPGDGALQTATIIPSMPGAGKSDEGATLLLIYSADTDEGDTDTDATGDNADSIDLTQHIRPAPDLSSIGEAIDIGGVEGVLIAFEDSDALQVVWQDCELTLTISSSAIDREQIVAMGESITEACPDAVG